jgi:hypothetical protein
MWEHTEMSAQDTSNKTQMTDGAYWQEPKDEGKELTKVDLY